MNNDHRKHSALDKKTPNEAYLLGFEQLELAA
jgi:hypothetical protein